MKSMRMCVANVCSIIYWRIELRQVGLKNKSLSLTLSSTQSHTAFNILQVNVCMCASMHEFVQIDWKKNKRKGKKLKKTFMLPWLASSGCMFSTSCLKIFNAATKLIQMYFWFRSMHTVERFSSSSRVFPSFFCKLFINFAETQEAWCFFKAHNFPEWPEN